MGDRHTWQRVPALLSGFEGEILRYFRQKLDVRYTISEGETADLRWHDLQFLNIEIDPPGADLSKEEAECLAYAKSNFWKFADIYSRRYTYVSDPLPEVQQAFTLTFRVCYRLIKRHSVGLVVFSNIPHEGYDYILYLIGKFLGIKIVMCHQSIIQNYFFLCDDIDDFGDFEQSPELREKEATGYTLPQNWFYMSGAVVDPTYTSKKMMAEIARNPRGLRIALMRHYYAAKYRKNAQALSGAPHVGETFIYFPLHLQPELTTASFGGEYADQLTALEILSARAPDGIWIYAKENPKQTEMQRGPLFFKRLAALRNVRLIDRAVSSIDLIRGSEGVATIAGTAGWEALFHGKPVLVFGRAWYASFKGVTRFRRELTVREFLDNKPPAVAETVGALDVLMSKAGKGIVDPGYIATVPTFDEAVNARWVCESLLAYLARSF